MSTIDDKIKVDDEALLSLEWNWRDLCAEIRGRLDDGFRNPESLIGMPPIPVPLVKTPEFRITAASGLILRAAALRRWPEGIRVGVCGCDLLAKLHMRMLPLIFGDRLDEVQAYGADSGFLGGLGDKRFSSCDHWRTAYLDADVFIASSASPFAYIDTKPKQGSVHLNLSLRDYFPSVLQSFDVIGVDRWENFDTGEGSVPMPTGGNIQSNGQCAHLTDLIQEEFWSRLPIDATVVFNVLGRGGWK